MKKRKYMCFEYLRVVVIPLPMVAPPLKDGGLTSKEVPTIWFIACCPEIPVIVDPFTCSTATVCTTDDAGTEADSTPP